MQPTNNPKPDAAFAAIASLADEAGVTWTQDVKGNRFGWVRLAEPALLTKAAVALAGVKARLATVTAYDPVREQGRPRLEIAYHFVLAECMFTVAVALDEAKPTVPSITPQFRNADWNEREFMEMYAISVEGHPNPKRLFLDESLDKGIMNQIIPLSTMMNGASTQDLWERIMAGRTDGPGNTDGTEAAPPAAEGKEANA